MAYDDEGSLVIDLQKIYKSYMNIPQDGKSSITVSGAHYLMSLSHDKFYEYETTDEDMVQFINVESKVYKNFQTFGQFFKWSNDGPLKTDLFVNESTFNWLRDGLTRDKKEFFKFIKLSLWAETKLDPETEKHFILSYRIEHVDKTD